MVTSSQRENRLADPGKITSDCLAIYGPACDAQQNQTAAIASLIAKLWAMSLALLVWVI